MSKTHDLVEAPFTPSIVFSLFFVCSEIYLSELRLAFGCLLLGIRRGLKFRLRTLYVYAGFTGDFHRKSRSGFGGLFLKAVISPREESFSLWSGEPYTDYPILGLEWERKVEQISVNPTFSTNTSCHQLVCVSWFVDSILSSLENKLPIFWGAAGGAGRAS